MSTTVWLQACSVSVQAGTLFLFSLKKQPMFGTILVKGKEQSEELKKEIQKYVKEHTAPYKYPRIVEYVQELPKTLGGKIKRKELREEDERMYAEMNY